MRSFCLCDPGVCWRSQSLCDFAHFTIQLSGWILSVIVGQEAAMFSIGAQQNFAVVGSAYISEHHSEEVHRYLPSFENEGVFDEILRKLRSALSCGGRKDQ
jgi:hypothetical protein